LPPDGGSTKLTRDATNHWWTRGPTRWADHDPHSDSQGYPTQVPSPMATASRAYEATFHSLTRFTDERGNVTTFHQRLRQRAIA